MGGPSTHPLLNWDISTPCTGTLQGYCQYTGTLVRNKHGTGNWARCLPTGLPDWAAQRCQHVICGAPSGTIFHVFNLYAPCVNGALAADIIAMALEMAESLGRVGRFIG